MEANLNGGHDRWYPRNSRLRAKTADNLIDTTPDVLDYSQIVVQKYLEKFGNKDGVCKFAETFNLVYMLRTPKEVLTYTGSSLPELKLNLTLNSSIEDGKCEADPMDAEWS